MKKKLLIIIFFGFTYLLFSYMSHAASFRACDTIENNDGSFFVLGDNWSPGQDEKTINTILLLNVDNNGGFNWSKEYGCASDCYADNLAGDTVNTYSFQATSIYKRINTKFIVDDRGNCISANTLESTNNIPPEIVMDDGYGVISSWWFSIPHYYSIRKINKQNNNIWEYKVEDDYEHSFPIILKSFDDCIVVLDHVSYSVYAEIYEREKEKENLIKESKVNSSEKHKKDGIVLVKLSTSGKQIWKINYPFTKNSIPRSITQLKNGNLLIAGDNFYVSGSTRQKNSLFLLLTDSDGKQLFKHDYKNLNLAYTEKLVEMKDGGFLLIGSASVQTKRKLYLLRIDNNFQDKWFFTYPNE